MHHNIAPGFTTLNQFKDAYKENGGFYHVGQDGVLEYSTRAWSSSLRGQRRMQIAVDDSRVEDLRQPPLLTAIAQRGQRDFH